MENRRTLLASLMIAAALVGCTAEDTMEDETTKPHAEQRQDMNQAPKDGGVHETEPVPVPSETKSLEDETSTWADNQLDNFLASNGANSLEAWPVGSPERNIIEVTSPDNGVVQFTIADGDYGQYEIEWLAREYMSKVGCAADAVQAVVVETESGSDTVTLSHC